MIKTNNNAILAVLPLLEQLHKENKIKDGYVHFRYVKLVDELNSIADQIFKIRNDLVEKYQNNEEELKKQLELLLREEVTLNSKPLPSEVLKGITGFYVKNDNEQVFVELSSQYLYLVRMFFED